LVCIGAPEYSSQISASTATEIHLFEEKVDAVQLVHEMSAGDVVLVKASRAEKFEELAQAISAKIEAVISVVSEDNKEGER
jgi:UDP-N-acetylmuramoyl-tripeptide--D-alanyl-D-alanine ligase